MQNPAVLGELNRRYAAHVREEPNPTVQGFIMTPWPLTAEETKQAAEAASKLDSVRPGPVLDYLNCLSMLGLIDVSDREAKKLDAEHKERLRELRGALTPKEEKVVQEIHRTVLHAQSTTT